MTETPSYVPEGIPTVTPYLCCRDSAAAIDFYVEVLGAREVGERFVDADGRVGHAEITLGDSLVYLSDEYPDHGVGAPRGELADVSLMVYVPDVDAAVAKAEAAGARVTDPVEEKFFGARRATIVDPFGHRWMIATHVRDVGQDDLRKAADDFARTS